MAMVSGEKEVIAEVKAIRLRTILIYAFRCALDSKTYVSAEVVECLIDVWGFFTVSDRLMFKREIKSAIERDLAGDACDIEQWWRILEMPDE